MNAFLPKLKDKNAKLKAIGEPELMEEELMAGRLYTGPMVTPPPTLVTLPNMLT